MNRTYALIWNHALGAWAVAHEHARKRGKGAGAVLATSLVLASSAFAADLPTGGQVVSGSGSINQPNAQQMVIDQASNKLAIDWQSFDIGSGNKVTFNQPGTDSIALNRVLGADGSKIMGQLDANGRVFIINPNGVLFGSGAQVNVGGLVASTLDLSVSDFEAGNYAFKGNSSNASVINNGRISAADGGSVALLGGTVSNNGVIVANQGTVALAAGNAVTLDFAGDGLLNVQIDEAVKDALVENRQLIQADGGHVILTASAADALLQTVVNNEGVIQARTLGEKEGRIVLLGDFDGGTVQVAGTLDASAPDGGNGGFIDTSGAHVQVAGETRVSTLSASGRTGTWLIDPTDINIDAASATAYQNALGASNVTISTAGSGSDSGNITINSAITWGANILTLRADNNITINAELTSTGTTTSDGLVLQYAQTTSTGDYTINAPVNLAKGSLFQTQHAADSVITYTVLTDLGAQGSTTGTDVQGMNGNLAGHYVLGANIDASATSDWNSGAGFIPIGDFDNRFTGTLNGLNHTITGLSIDRPSQDFAGLIGYADGATIQNIGMTGGKVAGRNNVGGLVGLSLNSNITNAYTTGTVSGSTWVGGLAGLVSGSSIANAYATGTVTGGLFTGGLAGYATNGSNINQTYATGKVSSSGNFVGGLVGDADSNTIFNSYYNTETTTKAGKGTGLTTAQMMDSANFVGFDFSSAWDNQTNQSAPYLLAIKPSSLLLADGETYTTIFTLDELQRINNNLSGKYALFQAIDASSTSGWNSGAGFSPIGNSSAQFTGSFNGLGHSISDLHIYRPDTDSVGLFGYVTAASISNISMLGGSVTGRSYVGGLAGINYGGSTIENVSTSASVIGTSAVGGLVGYNFSTIANSNATGDVIGIGSNIGGLVGLNSGNDAVIADSYATGAVSGAVDVVGGLVGSTSGTITNAYATGTVTAAGDAVGGLAGTASSSTITDSHATGSVTGRSGVGGLVGNNAADSMISGSFASGDVTGTGEYIGGLAGINHASIINSSATGNVTGTQDVGGLVGKNNGDGIGADGLVRDSFATGKVESEGGNVGGLIGINERGTVEKSFASGSVLGNTQVGGLVGNNASNGTITLSFASGNVIGNVEVGGLVGYNIGSRIEKSYATGQVSGDNYIGGLVGFNDGSSTIDQTYAIGVVTGNSNLGGLVGRNNHSTISDSFYNSETTGQGGEGIAKTTAEMNTKSTFTDAGWDFAADWGMKSTLNNGYPVLQILNPGFNFNTTSLTLNLNDLFRAYGGANPSWIGEYSLFGCVDCISIDWGSAITATTNAGTYAYDGSDVLTVTYNTGSANDYDITYVFTAGLTIDKAALTVTANDASKTYDGMAFTGGNGVSYSGFVNGEDVGVLGGTLVYGGSAQGAVNTGSYAISSHGLTSGNYAITFVDGTLTISGQPQAQPSNPAAEVPQAYSSILASLQHNIGDDNAPSPSFDSGDLYRIADSGIRLPEGLE